MYGNRWHPGRPRFPEYGADQLNHCGGHVTVCSRYSPYIPASHHCRRPPNDRRPGWSMPNDRRPDWSMPNDRRLDWSMPNDRRPDWSNGGRFQPMKAALDMSSFGRQQAGIKRSAASDSSSVASTPERQLKRGRTADDLTKQSPIASASPIKTAASAGGDNLKCSHHDSSHCHLSHQIENVFKNCRQTEAVYLKKVRLRDKVYNMLEGAFDRYELHIVGSSCTGFALNSSDMDLCLYLFESWVDQKFAAKKILSRVKNLLCKDVDFRVRLILAKVPILRFSSRCTGVQVDLNCNSIVGIRNTHLLQCYAALDDRVSRLIVIVKLWAKSHDINDASRSTLSSYTLVLLVIHFLQCGVDPAVLPNLQRLFRDKFQPDRPISQIPKFDCADIRCATKHNVTHCVGQLFGDFLQYYAHTFNFDKHVASVRTGTRLYKYQCASVSARDNSPRCWRYVCVEEPFTRTNTARAVHSGAEFERIVSVFRTSADKLSSDHQTVKDRGIVVLFGQCVSPSVKHLLTMIV